MNTKIILLVLGLVVVTALMTAEGNPQPDRRVKLSWYTLYKWLTRPNHGWGWKPRPKKSHKLHGKVTIDLTPEKHHGWH